MKSSCSHWVPCIYNPLIAPIKGWTPKEFHTDVVVLTKCYLGFQHYCNHCCQHLHQTHFHCYAWPIVNLVLTVFSCLQKNHSIFLRYLFLLFFFFSFNNMKTTLILRLFNLTFLKIFHCDIWPEMGMIHSLFGKWVVVLTSAHHKPFGNVWFFVIFYGIIFVNCYFFLLLVLA